MRAQLFVTTSTDSILAAPGPAGSSKRPSGLVSGLWQGAETVARIDLYTQWSTRWFCFGRCSAASSSPSSIDFVHTLSSMEQGR